MGSECPKREVLAQLVSGGLPDEEVGSLIEHVRTCDVCASIYRQFLSVRNLIKQLKKEEPPEGSLHRTVQHTQWRIQSLIHRKVLVRSILKRVSFYASIAAALLIALLIFTFLFEQSSRKHSSTTADSHSAITSERQTENRLPKTSSAPSEETAHPSPRIPEVTPELSVAPLKPPEEPVEAKRDVVKRDPKEGVEFPRATAESPKPPLPPLPPPFTEKKEEPPLPDIKQVLSLFAEHLKKNDLSGQIEQLHIAAKLKALDFLSSVATNRSYDVALRQEAMVALAEIGDKESVEVILNLLSDADWHLTTVSVPKALSALSDEETVEWLIKDVFGRSPSKEVRTSVAKALGYIQAPIPYDTLTKALKRESEPLVRFLVAESLGQREEKNSLTALELLLKDKEWFVRDAAVRSIGKLEGAYAAMRLLKHLSEEPSPLVLESIVKILARSRCEEAVRPLISLLKVKDRRLFGAVIHALVALTGKTFKTEGEWRNWFTKTGGKTAKPSDEVILPADFYFADIPFYTKSLVFVIDCSQQMMRTGRAEIAFREVEKAVALLPDFVLFNIICYDTYTRFFNHGGLVYANNQNKSKAAEFLKAQRIPQFASAILYDSLEKALELNPDDIILLSGGATSAGKFTNYDRILYELSYRNIFRKTRINVVGLFATTLENTENVIPVGPSVDFLKNLSYQNHGFFIWRWVTFKDSDGK